MFRNKTRANRCEVIVKEPIFDNNYIVLKVGRKIIKALLDTGSMATIIKKRVANQLGLKLRPAKA